MQLQKEVPESKQERGVILQSAGEDARAEQGTPAVLCREPWTSDLPLKDLSRDTHGWTQPSGASVTQAEAQWVALGSRGSPAAPLRRVVLLSGKAVGRHDSDLGPFVKCCLGLMKNAEQSIRV